MAYSKDEIPELIKNQDSLFSSGVTGSIKYRKKRLKALKKSIETHEKDVLNALKKDLGKPAFEAYASELGFVIQDIKHTLSHLSYWARTEKKITSLAHFPTQSKVYKQPLGKVLVLAPWNYPFQLVMAPIVSAIAAGNTVVVKLPWQTKDTSAVMNKILSEVFPPSELACLEIDDKDVIPHLIEQHRFDHIFFTGSTRVGRLILKAAADKLIPVTLELGGKSPAIIDSTAKLTVSVDRLLWSKSYNAGQTCVAPDYILVHESVVEKFKSLLVSRLSEIRNVEEQEGGYARIINERHFDSLDKQLNSCTPFFGGERNREELRINLALVELDSLSHPLMQQEIFGPILPIITWSDEQEIYEAVAKNPDPLACYIFSSKLSFQQRMIHRLRFGGGCVNNAIVHLSNPDLPFGGIGTSGLGRYHGKYGFDTFSHHKSIMKTATWLDLPVKYPPYSKWKMRIIKFFFG